jgi:prophage regulatory protein
MIPQSVVTQYVDHTAATKVNHKIKTATLCQVYFSKAQRAIYQRARKEFALGEYPCSYENSLLHVNLNHDAPLSRRMLRKKAVLQKLPFSNSTFYAYIKKGIIKPGVPIGPRMMAWPEDEIDAVVQSFIDKRDNQLVGGA